MTDLEAIAKLDPTLHVQDGELFRIVRSGFTGFVCPICPLYDRKCSRKEGLPGCVDHANQVGLAPESAYYVAI